MAGHYGFTFRFLRPVRGSSIMLVDADLLVPIKLRRRIIGRGVFYCLPSQINGDRGVGPPHIPDPLRRDEHLITEPPVARVHNEVANGPCFLLYEHALDVPNLTVGRLDVIANDHLTAAQVVIVILVPATATTTNRIETPRQSRLRACATPTAARAASRPVAFCTTRLMAGSAIEWTLSTRRTAFASCRLGFVPDRAPEQETREVPGATQYPD